MQYKTDGWLIRPFILFIIFIPEFSLQDQHEVLRRLAEQNGRNAY